MEFGKLEYTILRHNKPYRLFLTLIGQGDRDVLKNQGLRALRLRRIVRLTEEAYEQGHFLSYEDLSRLLVTSISTLKRDIAYLEKKGYKIRLKGRRSKVYIMKDIIRNRHMFKKERDGLINAE